MEAAIFAAINTMYRTHNCGELRIEHVGTPVTLAGWVQRRRDFGGMAFIDLRDRYGITQLSFNQESNADVFESARSLGREYVVQVEGKVIERSSKNADLSTGDIEIEVIRLTVLSESVTPPFTIENETDGGDELRMKYRYLDLRRSVVQEKLVLRHRLNQTVRNYLNSADFVEVETPYLIKSTPEGARDFVVPSRLNEGEFYALPQSPQTFKQLLMVSGFDRYFQIVKCFRDEDFRADRQPEFTQIDCEMSFVEMDDVLDTFEGMVRHAFKEVLDFEFDEIPRITYDEAMNRFGSDKPDMRFGMEFVDLKEATSGAGFKVFDEAETVIAICAPNAAEYTRKQLDALINWVKRPQIGAKGLVYCKCNEDGSFKSSVDKFYDQEALGRWAVACSANPGDLILVMSGKDHEVRKQLNELRLEMGNQLGLRDRNDFKAVWVTHFPLLEKDEETGHFHAMHHPFTSPVTEDVELLDSEPEKVKGECL